MRKSPAGAPRCVRSAPNVNSTGLRHRQLAVEQPARRRLQPHDHSAGRNRHEDAIDLVEDAGTRIIGSRPLSDPLQAVRAVEAVEIRDPGQQAKRMLPHVGAQRPAAKLDDGGRDGFVPDRAATGTAELAERTVDHGESVGRGNHRLERAITGICSARRQPFFRWRVALRIVTWRGGGFQPQNPLIDPDAPREARGPEFVDEAAETLPTPAYFSFIT